MQVGRRILILDDNVDVAESLAEILSLDGHEVILAHDGQSAVDLYFANLIEVGLFDVKMPGMNGVEAFLTIRARDPAAKIMMMSGYADDGLLAQAIENGAAGVLSKPFEAEVMIETIERLAQS